MNTARQSKTAGATPPGCAQPFRSIFDGGPVIRCGTDEYGDPIYRPLTVEEDHDFQMSEWTEEDARADYFGRECDR